MPIPIESEGNGRVTGTDRNLFWVRSGRDPQRDERVPKLVELESVQSGRGDRRLPPQPTKAAPPKWRSLRSGKNERVSPRRDVGVEMGAEFLNDAPWKRDGTPRPPRLGRAEGKFAVNVREGLCDRDTAPEHVNPLAPKPGQLSEAQATVDRQENQGAKACLDAVGQLGDFLGAEDRWIPPEPPVRRYASSANAWTRSFISLSISRRSSGETSSSLINSLRPAQISSDESKGFFLIPFRAESCRSLPLILR